MSAWCGAVPEGAERMSALCAWCGAVLEWGERMSAVSAWCWCSQGRPGVEVRVDRGKKLIRVDQG